MKGKDRQNQSLVIEVRVVVALGEEGLVIGREHEGAFQGAENI